MILPVRAKGERKTVECEFTSRFDDGVLEQWKAALGSGASSEQQDAIEYCESALAKLAFYREKQRFAASELEMMARSHREPEGEIMGVLSVTAPWWGAGEMLGFCLFRKTWSNNVVFDFLATHPQLLAGRPRPISGVGTAMLWRLALTARALQAKLVWAETTNTSVHFYAGVFGMKKLNDLFVLDADSFYERLHAKIY